MHAVGYIRVSTEEQGRSGLGLEAQEQRIRTECQRRGWELSVLAREVRSGKDMRRPKLTTLLQRLDTEGGVLIVAKLDRLSRSVADFSAVVERSRARGWSLRILDLDIDTATPVGEAVVMVLATFAQLERRMTGQRTREALVVKRSQGAKLGRPVTVDPGVRARVLELRASGMSFAAVARTLDTERVPTSHGAERWWPSTVRQITLSATTGC